MKTDTNTIKTSLVLDREVFIRLCSTADRLNLPLGRLANHLLDKSLNLPECRPPPNEHTLTGRPHRMKFSRFAQVAERS